MKSIYKTKLKNKYSALTALLFYIMGIAGILWGFSDIFGGYVSRFVYPLMLLLCVIIYALSNNRRAYFIHIIISLLFSAVFVYMKLDKIIPYAENIIHGMTVLKSLKPYDITYLVLALALLSGEAIAFLCIVFNCSQLYFILITAVMLLSSAMLRGISLVPIILITLSAGGLYISQNTSALKGSIKICIFSLVFIPAVFLLSDAVIDKKSETLYDAADEVESFINDNINSIVYNRGIDYDSGKVNRGNNHQTGKDALELWLSDKPEEDLYLRGFSGGDYIDGQWTEADESDFFTRISTERGWSRWGNLVDTTYKEIYYNANSISNPDVLRRGKRLTINPITGGIKNRYYPYIERWERLTRKQNIAYVYSYYELKDLNIVHDNLFGQVLRVYDDMQKNYEPYVYETYLNVPEGLDRLKELCQSADVSSTEETIAFVQNTLAENADYTLKPGMAPLNEDIVEYFLFENKRGYCVHFASAAVLMFRMLGIPSRYVTGYRVNKGLFYKQEDEDYYARISDRYAHAWPEIYIRDKGWIPVEATPSLSNVIAAENNGKTDEQEIATENTILTTEKAGEETTYSAVSNNRSYNIPLIAVLVFTILFVFLRRLILLEKIKKSPVRRLFAQSMDIAAFYNERLTGLEKDFVQRLTLAVPDITPKQAERLIETVFAEAYGGNTADEKDREFALDMYRKTAEYVYRKSNIFKKLYIKLIKVWL